MIDNKLITLIYFSEENLRIFNLILPACQNSCATVPSRAKASDLSAVDADSRQ
jgi:hypothetical protein